MCTTSTEHFVTQKLKLSSIHFPEKIKKNFKNTVFLIKTFLNRSRNSLTNTDLYLFIKFIFSFFMSYLFLFHFYVSECNLRFLIFLFSVDKRNFFYRHISNHTCWETKFFLFVLHFVSFTFIIFFVRQKTKNKNVCPEACKNINK